jgi:hypothetical protein
VWSSFSKMKSEVLEVPTHYQHIRQNKRGYIGQCRRLTSEGLLSDLFLTFGLIDEEKFEPRDDCQLRALQNRKIYRKIRTGHQAHCNASDWPCWVILGRQIAIDILTIWGVVKRQVATTRVYEYGVQSMVESGKWKVTKSRNLETQ